MGGLLPFFTYYGGKWRAAEHYPKPREHTIIEPFAGAAGYATRYPGRDIILRDMDEYVIGLWRYLIRVSSLDIMRIPVGIESVDDIPGPEEARWLVGWWMNKGAATPHRRPSSWMKSNLRPKSYWGEEIRFRIATQVPSIRHWKAELGSYTDIENKRATWFIDPPYVGDSGRLYRHNTMDFDHLARFCREREGQVIVCEQAGATWLPFAPFNTIKTNPGKRGKKWSREVLWYKEGDGE